MAHYAFLNENNFVTEVITGRNEDEVVNGISDWEHYYGLLRGQKCVRTSYNSKIRANFAVIGGYYDERNDVFISPKPYDSWILDDQFRWRPPVALPADAYTLDNLDGVMYQWDEQSKRWVNNVNTGSNR